MAHQQVLTSAMNKLGLSKRVLLLGSGYVTRPCVKVLVENGVHVTVACRTLSAAQDLSRGFAGAEATAVDASKPEELDAAIATVDLVISLIPYTMHANVIQAAIRQKKHVVTTSYVSPAMRELDASAKAAGITVMNEIGLDPGIDHLYAVKMIDDVHRAGGRVKSFLSYCGGLPAPEASDNPLGYKFSWSSRGVLLALRNANKFWQDGKVVETPGAELMASARPFFIYPGFNFVAYGNRDSTPYKQVYNIPEADTIIRGTLRYAGFPEFVRTLVAMGFLSETPLDILSPSNPTPPTWAEATAAILGASSSSEKDLLWAITSKASFADNDEKDRIVTGLRWLDLLSDKRIAPRGNPLDTLVATMDAKMAFEPGERDFIMLQHKIQIEHADGRNETRTSTLCEYGEPTAPGSTSAMAKLVGVPCAVATLMVLDGRIAERGVTAPLSPELAEVIRLDLEARGIEMKEKTIA